MQKCPLCGKENAYIGAFTVECATADCDHYTEKQATLYMEDLVREIEQLTRSSKPRTPSELPSHPYGNIQRDVSTIPIDGWSNEEGDDYPTNPGFQLSLIDNDFFGDD